MSEFWRLWNSSLGTNVRGHIFPVTCLPSAVVGSPSQASVFAAWLSPPSTLPKCRPGDSPTHVTPCSHSSTFTAQHWPQVRRWIKSPMVSVDKHQSPNLKYTGPAGVHLPPGESDFEAMCQSCLGDHAFQRGMLPPEESCSWEIQPGCEGNPCERVI